MLGGAASRTVGPLGIDVTTRPSKISGQELSPEELVSFERQHLNFRVFENAHYQFQGGLLEPQVMGPTPSHHRIESLNEPFRSRDVGPELGSVH